MSRPHPNNTLTLLDIIFAVLRYRWRCAATVVCVLALCVVGILVFPKKYESESKLFVRLGRGSVTMDTAATTSKTISIQESRETEMNSVVDMLQSRRLAEAVALKVDPERILKKHALLEQLLDAASSAAGAFSASAPVSETGDGQPAMTSEEVYAQQRLELAIKDLSKNVKVTSPKRSTTVTVACRARDPQLAREIASVLLEEYQKMHLDAYKSEGSFFFFEKNFAEHERMVRDYEDQMRSAKNEMTLITIAGKQESLQKQITDIQGEILNASADLESARAALVDYMGDMERLDEEVPTQTTSGIANGASESMRDRLYELEIQEKELAAKYKPVHPLLVKLRKQLSESRQVLAEQDPERQHSVMSANPVRQDTHKLLIAEKAKIAGFEAKLDSLRHIESELYAQLREVNSFEMKSAELQRKIDISAANHRIYATKLEEARINNALDQEAISNVSVVQPPTLALKHVSPKRSVLAALSLVFAGLCGVLMGVVSDRRRTEDEFMEVPRRRSAASPEEQQELAAAAEKERAADDPADGKGDKTADPGVPR